MLSQSVLLRDVNDSVEALRGLMRAFVETRIKPHVINQLDPARGTSHFRVPLAEAQELMRCAAIFLAFATRHSFSIFPAASRRKNSRNSVFATTE